MKTLLSPLVAAAIAASALAGCAIVPAEPVAYAPAPVVVVRPHPYYVYGGPYWHRGWH